MPSRPLVLSMLVGTLGTLTLAWWALREAPSQVTQSVVVAATVDASDLAALGPWLDWAFATVKSELVET